MAHPARATGPGEGLAKMIIAVPEKYALEVSSPTPITSERQHEEYLSVLDKLASKENLTREEEKYAEVLMTLIEAYEEEHRWIPNASPVEVIRALMDAHDLRQKDLVPIFGWESIVSEVLHKKRELNKSHIEKLGKRFKVSPAVFF
jgi:HTH-type transcriptional regulator / antitoxin HigA